MRPFRFRAAAALTLRRTEEDDARQQLATAQAVRNRAQERANAAQAAAHAACEAAADACQSGAPGGLLAWHQSWILRTRIEADACRRAAAVSAEAVGRATAAVQVAHQRRRALERLRDRSWQRHRLDAGRHELREMNELATLRHQARPDEDPVEEAVRGLGKGSR